MPTPTYSQLQREYWSKRPADVLQFFTVEFFHPDFGFIRLVQDQFSDRILDVDGTPETFQAAAMEIPQVTNQSTDSTQAGSISFGRIGTQVRQKLLLITPLGAINFPIQVKIRQYQDGVTTAIYERRLFVNKNGITINADAVTVQLSVDNPAKLANEGAFYDPEVWTGLRSI
jgi:hypothetical protein